MNDFPDPFPDPPGAAEVRRLRAALWQKGYAPVPVATGEKSPFYTGWPARAQAGEFAAMDCIFDPAFASTVIDCAGLRAIDIDIDDQALVQFIYTAAGEAGLPEPGGVRVRENSSRVLWLYRAAEGQPRKRVLPGAKGKIEILGRGQQFVADGVHESGAPYLWDSDLDFPECLPPLSELPIVTEETITAFFALAAPIIDSAGETKPADAAVADHAPTPGDLKAVDLVTLAAIVRQLPNDSTFDNRNEWLKLAHALAAAFADDPALAERLWLAHAAKRDQAEDDNGVPEPVAVWNTLNPPHRAGAEYIVATARRLGIDVSAYQSAKAGAAFAASPLPVDAAAGAGGALVTMPGFAPVVVPAAPLPDLHVVAPSTLHAQVIPERRWIVPGWAPAGHVSALYGDGGVGKTLLAQQLATACATGAPWCGLPVMRCRAFGLFCEDDREELQRRQAAINAAFSLSFSDLGEMRWSSGVGQDNTLAFFSREGIITPLPMFDALRAAVLKFGARLVILDTAADLFGGNENDRGQVRRFIGLLNRLAQEINGAVLLTAHPSRAGKATGDLDGGSTGWSNSVRSRWTLGRPEGDRVTLDTPLRVLTRRKANYAGIGDAIRLRWVNGVLLPATADGSIGEGMQRRPAEAVFLGLLDRAETRGERVSASRHAVNYAPKLFARSAEAEGYTAAELAAALDQLLAAGRITAQPYGRPSDDRRCIVRAEPTAFAAP